VKLVIAVVHPDDAAPCTQALADAGFVTTRLATSGGFLQRGNVAIVTGVDDERVDEVIALVRERARARREYVSPIPPMAEPAEMVTPFPVEVEVGGATVFVLDVVRYERL
jgi:uncharacterized protein YaaQ